MTKTFCDVCGVKEVERFTLDLFLNRMELKVDIKCVTDNGHKPLEMCDSCALSLFQLAATTLSARIATGAHQAEPPL